MEDKINYYIIIISNIVIASFVYLFVTSNSYNQSIKNEKTLETHPIPPINIIISKDLNNKQDERDGCIINEPTRGCPQQYQSIGTVSNTEKTILMPLYGRQVYPGSSNWNYYCESNDFQKMKVGVHYQNKNCYSEYGCNSISSGDTVEVPEIGGIFTVNLHDNCIPRYIPRI